MNLQEVLVHAQSGDYNLRHTAEEQLNHLQQSNLPWFLVALSQELAGEGKPPQARHLAGLLIKNVFTSRDEARRPELIKQWVDLEITIRQQIKNNILTSLGSPVKEARMSASQAVATIGAIELPLQLWPELISGLLTNIQNGKDEMRESTLQALGYICEEVDPELLAAYSNPILKAVVTCMRKEEPSREIRLSATRAILNSIEFIRSNFLIEEDRDCIMATLLETMAPATSPDAQVRATALQALVRIAQLYYPYLPRYMGPIFDVTCNAIKNDVEDVAKQAVEFWSTLCDEEIEILEAEEEETEPPHPNQNFISNALQYLVPLLLETLTKQEEDQDDNWTLAEAAATCLALAARTVGDAIVPFIMPFVTQNVNNQNWHYKEAALMAFGSMLEGPNPTILKPTVDQGVNVMLYAIDDPHVCVRDTAAWALGRICSLHPDAITLSLLPGLIGKVLEKLREEPRVASRLCWILHNLAEAYADHCDDETSPFSQYFAPIAENLLKVVARSDSNEEHLRSGAFEALSVLIQSGAQDTHPHAIQLLPIMTKKLEETLNSQCTTSDDRTENIEQQGLLCGLIQSIVQKVPGQIAPMADEIMALLLRVLQLKHATIHQDGLLAVSAVAAALDVNFLRYMPHFAPFLATGLQNWQETEVCQTSVGIVGDMCRALDKEIAPFCDTFMYQLLQNLQNPNLDKNVKPPILSCVGDIALAIGAQFKNYVQFVVPLLQQASSIRVSQDDEEMIDYANALRVGIFEAYTGILQGFQEAPECIAMMESYIPPLLQFINDVSLDDNRDEAVCRTALGLLGDLASAFRPKIAQVLNMNQSYVRTLLQDCTANSASQAAKKTARWASTKIEQIAG